MKSEAKEEVGSGSPLRMGMKLQRYSRSPHCSPPVVGCHSTEKELIVEAHEIRGSKEKVGLLKKLLEHYHIRTIEKSYYSSKYHYSQTWYKTSPTSIKHNPNPTRPPEVSQFTRPFPRNNSRRTDKSRATSITKYSSRGTS